MFSGPTTSMEELLQFLYLTPVGVVKFKADGAVDLINPAASAILLSLTPGEPLTNIYASLVSLAPDLPRHVAQFNENSGTVIDQQRLEAHAGGKTIVLSLSLKRVNDDVYMAVLKDVTKMAEQEQRLFADQQKFRAIFEYIHDYAIYTITLDGIMDEWNHSVERYSGWRAAEVQGYSISLFFPPEDPESPDLSALLAEAKRVGSVETEGWQRTRDNSRLWANTVITALPDGAGTVRGFVVVSRDMTERKRMEDNLKLLATVDSLTGAYNRRQGNVLLLAEFARRARDGRPFAALLLDIDHFKAINDRFGHAAGDTVLRALVLACQSTLRLIDIVVRWGGEEFLLLLPGVGTGEAVTTAERVRAVIAAMQIPILDGAPLRITVSIGAAVPAGESPEQLLRRSDVALYAAKAGGRNKVVLAP
jgi:diguanylate cyclase (GGDEF)-like protein/PAS domain S-box-containing protein